MNNFLKIIFTLVLFSSFWTVNAVQIEIQTWTEQQNEIKIKTTTNEKQKKESITDQITKWNKKIENISLVTVFEYFSKFFEEKTPESYKYISLNFTWIEPGSEFEKSLKILVYNNKIANLKTNLSKAETTYLNSAAFYELAYRILWTWYSQERKESWSTKKIDYYDLEIIEESYIVLKNKELYERAIEMNTWTNEVFWEVYETIINEHFEKEKLDKNKLIYWAIEWLTKATNDKHTIYFPPTESKDFLSSLSWDFEWIWTYVEMPEPGKFVISAPIPDSPAEKAWIKWWDEVIAVDWKEITKEHSQLEIISWIKGKAWTEVNLKIKRWSEILEFKIKREMVHLKSIKTEFNWNSFIIKINWFNENVAKEFVDALNELKQKIWIKKIIIDLRDNWGWYLNEAVEILSLFVPKWKPVTVVKYPKSEWNYLSKWWSIVSLDDYELVFLQNGSTASASEIVIWTMKDYFPKIKVIWTKSYWKGSVQAIKEFSDGSSFKYTTAKWFTWRSKTWIDWVWITPDVEIELDETLLKEKKIDNQLEKALSI